MKNILMILFALVTSSAITLVNWFLIPVRFLYVIIPAFILSFILSRLISSAMYVILFNKGNRNEAYSELRIFVSWIITYESALVAVCRPECDLINIIMLMVTLVAFVTTLISLAFHIPYAIMHEYGNKYSDYHN